MKGLSRMAVLAEIPEERMIPFVRERFPSRMGFGLSDYCTEKGFLDTGVPETHAVAESFFWEGGKHDPRTFCNL